VPTASGPGPIAQLPGPDIQSAPLSQPPQPVPAPAPVPIATAGELLRQAEAAFAAQDVARAEPLYGELLFRYPTDPLAASALFRLGEIAIRREDYEAARRRFEELLLQFPVSPLAPSARYRLAYADYRLRRVEDAVEILKGLAGGGSLDPLQQAQAHLLLGQGFAEIGRPVEAARTYARLLALSPPAQFRTEADQRLTALLADDRFSRADLEDLAATGPGAAAPLARLSLSRRALEDGDAVTAERLAREVLASPAPAGAPPDLATRAQAVLDEALRVAGADPGVVGVVLPLSGRYQAFGERLLHGLMLAAGVFAGPQAADPPIRLAIRDSAGEPAGAVRAVEELVAQERVIAVVGPLVPAEATEAARTAQRLAVPLLALSQRPKLTEIGPFVFRPFTTGALQAQAIARQAMEREGLARFAVLYPDDPSGLEMLEAFRAEVVARGGVVTDAVGFEPAQTDFGKEIRRLAKVKAAPRTRRPRPGETPPELQIDFDALFIPAYYDRVALIAPQLAFYDVKGIRLLGVAGWNSQDLVREAREHVQGALFVDPFWAGSQNPPIREFVGRFKARFDETPTILEAQAYDAMRILLDTLRRERPTSREALRQALSQIQAFPGLTGPVAFSPEREALRSMLLLTIDNRRIRQVN
jgi:ABC-type branched-subunit amino acid transport system substrate-binding protein